MRRTAKIERHSHVDAYSHKNEGSRGRIQPGDAYNHKKMKVGTNRERGGRVSFIIRSIV